MTTTDLRAQYQAALAAHSKPISDQDQAQITVMKKAIETINRDGAFFARVEQIDQNGYAVSFMGRGNRNARQINIAHHYVAGFTAVDSAKAADKLVTLMIDKLASNQAQDNKQRTLLTQIRNG